MKLIILLIISISANAVTGWDGSGNFLRGDGTREGATTWAQAKTANQKITASAHDTHDEILAVGIEACLAKNGENSMTGNLNMGGFSFNNWTQASDVTFGTNINLILQGDITAEDGDYSGDLDAGGTVTGDFVTATDTLTTPTLDVNAGSTFDGGSNVFSQYGTTTAISILGSMSDNGYLLRSQDSGGYDVLSAHASGYVYIEQLRVATATPASASATCTAGTIVWDTSYVYVCVATNTWKRTGISTW